MKKKLLLLAIVLAINSYAQNQKFTSFNVGTSFTAITVDGNNKRVWAGTNQNGVYQIDSVGISNETAFLAFGGSAPSGPPLNNIRIKSMAADKSGNVWIGHQGTNYTGGQGGMERINSALNIKHYHSETNYTYTGLPYNRRDGLATRRVTSVCVDKFNTVWSAHKYTDLTTTGGGSSLYILQPGAFSYKADNSPLFTTIGGWKPRLLDGQPTEFPYPAYTYNVPISATPGARIVDVIACDNSKLYVAVRGYHKKTTDSQSDLGYIEPRVMVYSLNDHNAPTPDSIGNAYINIPAFTTGFGFLYSEMEFPTGGGIINGVCANNAKGVWVSKSIAGAGFSVYKDNTWTYIDFSQIIPPNTRFNANAMWKDEAGRVFMGTNNGLIVYNGHSDPTLIESYKLYTDYDYGSTAGNTHNIYDTDMISSNILGGSADPNDVNVSWVVTDSGIMKLFLPIEGMIVYNINEHFTYYNTTVDTEENITFVTQLTNQEGLVNSEPDYAEETEYPIVSADGTGSTLFRFDTVDPQGFYDGINGNSSKYHIYVGPGGDVATINSENYIKQYGLFRLKALSSYEGSPATAENLKYVEVEYIHPKYIDPTTYETGKNYAIFDYIIKNTESGDNLFKHPIKVSVAPIILAHGVWTDMSSMQKMEDFLKKSISEGGGGYDEFMIKKVWRHDKNLAENSYFGYGDAGDYKIIPNKIKELKKTAAINLFSTGKINIVSHSRGGLYTRAYVEGLMGTYKEDVNSLVTINTPHFGAQGANLVLDDRIILNNNTMINTYINDVLSDIELISIPVSPNGLTIGNIASVATVPKNDRINNWGAKVLLVELDAISGVYAPNTTASSTFINRVNSEGYVGNMTRIPIHTISSQFDPCLLYSWMCNDLSSIPGEITDALPKRLRYGVYIYNAFITVSNDLPNAINQLTAEVYDGEPNDFVVPISSMQAGLAGTSFNTHLSGNIMHSTIGGPIVGVTEQNETHQKVKTLLRANKIDESVFTMQGITPQKIRYNFFPNFHSNSGRNVNENTSKILINRDPAIFDNVSEGSVLNFKVFAKDVDKIMIEYENENTPDMYVYGIRNNVTFENDYSYTIPEGHSGKMTIRVTGFKNGVVGVATSTVTLDVGIPNTLTLQSIHFTHRDPTVLNQDEYTYDLIGTYSDGIDRIINDINGVAYTIEDTAISSQVDNKTIKAEAVGVTLFTAKINDLEDTIIVTVERNPSLNQTILTSFYGTPNVDNSAIDINWKTLREYESATFVLETSYNTPDNFVEINRQAGNGTTNTPAQFNYVDTSFGANTVIYYRIKMIDTQGNITYSSTIKMDLSTAGVGENNVNKLTLEIYPNPVKTDEVTLRLDSKLIDKNAKLELYSLQGKRLSIQTLNILEGSNSFKLKIGQGLTKGIYLVKVSTAGYIKTIKLIVK